MPSHGKQRMDIEIYHITEVTVLGMGTYILDNFPWLDHACSWVVTGRGTLKEVLKVFILLMFMIFIFQPRIMPNLFFNLPKIISSIENFKIFPILILPNFQRLLVYGHNQLQQFHFSILSTSKFWQDHYCHIYLYN